MSVLDRDPMTMYSLTPDVRRYISAMFDALGTMAESAQTTVVSASGALTATKGFNLFVIDASSALTLTMDAPTTAMNSWRVQIISMGAYAHEIDIDGTLYNGGSSTYDTITFDSNTAGSSLEMVAYDGYWYQAGTNNVTLSKA